MISAADFNKLEVYEKPGTWELTVSKGRIDKDTARRLAAGINQTLDYLNEGNSVIFNIEGAGRVKVSELTNSQLDAFPCEVSSPMGVMIDKDEVTAPDCLEQQAKLLHKLTLVIRRSRKALKK